MDPEEVSNSTLVGMFMLFVGVSNFAIIVNCSPYKNKVSYMEIVVETHPEFAFLLLTDCTESSATTL